MDSQNLQTITVWPAIVAIVLAVFLPLILWCIYAFRMRQSTISSILGMATAEIAALAAIAVLAHF